MYARSLKAYARICILLITICVYLKGKKSSAKTSSTTLFQVPLLGCKATEALPFNIVRLFPPPLGDRSMLFLLLLPKSSTSSQTPPIYLGVLLRQRFHANHNSIGYARSVQLQRAFCKLRFFETSRAANSRYLSPSVNRIYEYIAGFVVFSR